MARAKKKVYISPSPTEDDKSGFEQMAPALKGANLLRGGKKEKKKKDMKAMVSRRRDARGKASTDEASRGYPGAQVDVSKYVYGEGRNFTSGDGSALQIAQLAYADNDDADALYYYNGVLKKAFEDRGAVATSNASAGHVAVITGKSNATIGLTTA